MSNPMQQFAMNLINQRLGGNLSNLSPQQQAMLQAIQNNDSKTGEEIANNLCQTYGISKEQAIAKAREFFHI